MMKITAKVMMISDVIKYASNSDMIKYDSNNYNDKICK